MKRRRLFLLFFSLCVLGFIAWIVTIRNSPLGVYQRSLGYHNAEQFDKYYDTLSVRAKAEADAWASDWTKSVHGYTMSLKGKALFVEAKKYTGKLKIGANVENVYITGNVAELIMADRSVRMVYENGQWKRDQLWG